MKKYPLILIFLVVAAAACQGKKDKKNDPPAVAQTTAPVATPAPTTPTTTTPTTTTPTAPASTSWQINKENCAARGHAFDAEKANCLRIVTKEACEALANGSKFELKFGLGECVGPALQASAANCALLGKKFDQALSRCQIINTKTECDALANGSVFDTGYNYCKGVKFLRNTDNCAAYGSKYDSATGLCMRLETEAACTALNSGALFIYGSCQGRCEHSDSILEDDCLLD